MPQNANKPHLEMVDGEAIGLDPRKLSTDDLERLGHKRMSQTKAIRLKCLDCCVGSSDEVRKCVAVACPSWPFRMGTNPWRAKREVDPEHMAKMRAKL